MVSVLLVGFPHHEAKRFRRDLNQAGFVVYQACNAEDAMRSLKSMSIQILICAEYLPEHSIAEFVNRLEPWKSQLHMLLLASPQDHALHYWLSAQGIGFISPDPARCATEIQNLKKRFAQPVRVLRNFHFQQISFFDLLQILALSQHSLQLYLADAYQAHEGLLSMSQGQIKHALFGETLGGAALDTLVQTQTLYFREVQELSSDCYTLQSRVPTELLPTLMRQAQWQKSSQQFQGSLSNLQMLDVLQILSFSRRSHVIQVRDTQQNETGAIVLKNGLLEHAHFQRLTALAALQHILKIGVGQFDIQAYVSPGRQNLGQSFTQCILELLKTHAYFDSCTAA